MSLLSTAQRESYWRYLLTATVGLSTTLACGSESGEAPEHSRAGASGQAGANASGAGGVAGSGQAGGNAAGNDSPAGVAGAPGGGLGGDATAGGTVGLGSSLRGEEHQPLSIAKVTRSHSLARQAELSTGITFLRVGPALRYAVGRFAIATSLAVGPTYTWVTAGADPPYIGQSAAAFGVLGSAGLAIAYPARSAVFAAVAARASLLLPNPRILLPDETRRDLGPLLVDASLSIGLRL